MTISRFAGWPFLFSIKNHVLNICCILHRFLASNPSAVLLGSLLMRCLALKKAIFDNFALLDTAFTKWLLLPLFKVLSFFQIFGFI